MILHRHRIRHQQIPMFLMQGELVEQAGMVIIKVTATMAMVTTRTVMILRTREILITEMERMLMDPPVKEKAFRNRLALFMAALQAAASIR